MAHGNNQALTSGFAMKNSIHAFIILLIMLFTKGALAVEVGYVNIINGQIPAEAFVIERQGAALKPDGVYTNLEEGDVVKPLPGAALLYTPNDTSCPSVDIKGEFVASGCAGGDMSMTDVAFDLLVDEFMAAPLEKVGMYATRGAADNTAFTLPPRALRLFLESPDLIDSFGQIPFISVAKDKSEADLLVSGNAAQVTLSNPDGGRSATFNLPADEAKLRWAVLARLNLATLASLEAFGPWPEGLSWSVEVLTASEAGSLDYDGRRWSPIETVKVGAPLVERVDVSEPCLLRFAFDNKGEKSYYAYLANYTDEGQVLLALPPEAAGTVPNLVPAGGSLELPQIFLELGAPVESVRLIVSERPLDLSQFPQDGLDSPSNSKPIRMRPIARDVWQTALVVFTLK